VVHYGSARRRDQAVTVLRQSYYAAVSKGVVGGAPGFSFAPIDAEARFWQGALAADVARNGSFCDRCRRFWSGISTSPMA